MSAGPVDGGLVGSAADALLRDAAPQVLTALMRRYGDFDDCEDAVQEALLAAARTWLRPGATPAETPDNPAAWLTTVAARRRIEQLRADAARRRREQSVAGGAVEPADPVPAADDSLALFLLCCHPSLTPVSQMALTLRAIGGLTTAEIARALFVPESTVAQRISRAKRTIQASGRRFPAHPPGERAAPIAAVLRVLYLIFNEGYTASSGPSLHRVALSDEAIRLTRQLRRELPDDGEVAGLLALMLLTDARRPARTRSDGALVPLAEQDRSRWTRAAIDEGVALISASLAVAPVGPYQLQAAIAAVHDEAEIAENTDWRQILGLYELLAVLAPGPMVTLNRIVAVAMVHGPRIALGELAAAADDPALAGHHRVAAVRAHLLDMAGRSDEARSEFRVAARLTLSDPERRYLFDRAGPERDAPD